MSQTRTNMSKRKSKEATWKQNVHAAAAVNAKMDFFTLTMRSLREMAEKEAKLVQCALKDMENNLIDPKHILELTKSIHGTGERSITEYINRNTEILLNEHASVIRQQVIENMKMKMREMSNELTQNAQKLENNISDFFELIESSYESTSASFQKVIHLAEENHKRDELIEKTKDELFSIESDVKKLEEQLLECLMCYAFLDSLFPNAQKGKMLDLPKDFLKSFGPSFEEENRKLIQRKVIEDIKSSGENFEPFEAYIESAKEIVKVIDRIKDSNLSLVHNSRLSQEMMKFERQEIDEVKKKMEDDLKSYDEKIASVENDIEKAKDLQEKLQKQLREMQDDQAGKESLLQVNEMEKLSEIYKLCTGSDTKNVEIFLMKATIDYCLDDLFHELNKYPKRKVKEMMKILESEKKLKERKIEEALRAERLQKRLQRDAKLSGKKVFQ